MAAFGTAAAWQAHTVVDQRGKTHEFRTPAERVVTIAIPLYWHFLTVDGSEKRVVGANAVAVEQMRDGIVSRVFPGAQAVPTAITRGGTFTPNVEALLALKPDAIFQWADRGNALVDVLDAVGLRTLGVKNTNAESDIDAWVRMSGAVAGKVARADSIIRYMRGGNNRFDAMTVNIPAAQRPRVLMLTEYSRQITPSGPASYGNLIIRRAGGINAATTDGAVSIEQVLAWNPEVILLTPFESKTPADLMRDPLWSRTPAARARRVYKLPFGLTRWGGYGPESPMFLAWLTSLLHPAQPGIALRDEMRSAYRTLYRFNATDADLDQVLQMNVNRASAGYARFQATSRP
jgi:iron complex transport system substrate-binding protein